jgi:hypothetical protein
MCELDVIATRTAQSHRTRMPRIVSESNLAHPGHRSSVQARIFELEACSTDRHTNRLDSLGQFAAFATQQPSKPVSEEPRLAYLDPPACTTCISGLGRSIAVPCWRPKIFASRQVGTQTSICAPRIIEPVSSIRNRPRYFSPA